MSGVNVHEATVRRLVDEVWNGRNLDALPEVYAEDATLRAGDTALVGIAAIRDGYMRPFQEAFPDLRHEIADLLIDGDRVALRFRGRGTQEGEYLGIAPSGKVRDFEAIAIFRMEAGRIAEVWAQSNRAQKLAEF
jgi:predicted ester cyclase